MAWYRVANFIMQAAYLIGHLLFMRMLFQKRQPTPVWRWFFCLCACTWLWVLGRFLETVVYLFLPGQNAAYLFAANFQYIGDTTAIVVYLIWILYLSGRDVAASSPWLRALLFLCPAAVCVLAFTNERHHLFYTRLAMGQPVQHGLLFAPCLAWSYLLLLLGYAVSVRMVLHSGRDRVTQLALFSLFPLTPALGALIRSVTGVDRLDYTPLMMAVTLFSLYALVFRYHYVNIIPASIREVMEQTVHPIAIITSGTGSVVYCNRAARESFFPDDGSESVPTVTEAGRYEENVRGRQFAVEAKPLEEENALLVTATDITDLAVRQRALNRQIAQQEELQTGLEEARWNIEAYLDTLHSTAGMKEKREQIDLAYREIETVFLRVRQNLETAAEAIGTGEKKEAGAKHAADGRALADSVEEAGPERAETALQENLTLTRDCIAMIRRTVAELTAPAQTGAEPTGPAPVGKEPAEAQSTPADEAKRVRPDRERQQTKLPASEREAGQ